MPPVRISSLRLAAVTAALFLLGSAPAAHARTYEDAVLEHSLWYWRLGEAGTFSIDRNGGVGSTVQYGNQVTPQEPGALAQNSNGSVRLFGAVADDIWESNLWIDYEGAYVEAPGRRPFAWEIWVKPASLDATTRRIISAETMTGGYLVGARKDALVFSRYTKAPEAWSTLSVPAPAIGEWTHVAATYDGTRMALYVNGALAASRTSTLELPAWTPPPAGHNIARLGGHSLKWLEWNGWLDEASYARTLPADAIAEHYRLGALPPAR